MSQSLSKIYVHAIFSTKDREALIDADWREDLFRMLGGAAKRVGCPSLVAGGMADHVHILFQLGRTITIAEAVSKIKSGSSTWVNRTGHCLSRFSWQSGYAAFSVSQSSIEAVRTYIMQQPEHHMKQSFEDELREWLRRYEIEWDERHLWD